MLTNSFVHVYNSAKLVYNLWQAMPQATVSTSDAQHRAQAAPQGPPSTSSQHPPPQPGGRVFVVGSNPQVMARQVPGAVYIPPTSFAQTWQV
eukprot:3839927-Pyramimonas_sp.AAC.1